MKEELKPVQEGPEQEAKVPEEGFGQAPQRKPVEMDRRSVAVLFLVLALLAFGLVKSVVDVFRPVEETGFRLREAVGIVKDSIVKDLDIYSGAADEEFGRFVDSLMSAGRDPLIDSLLKKNELNDATE